MVFFTNFPKLLFYVYVLSTVNFSFQGFINYLTTYGHVAKYNANAFLNWHVPNLYDKSLFFLRKFRKIFSNRNFINFNFSSIFIIEKNIQILHYLFFSTIALLSALVYPTIFSAPYPRDF